MRNAMIYDANNCMPRCTVYDVDAKERIDRVVAVNAKAGWVQVAEQPLRVTEHDHIATRLVRFASIYPIKGGEHWPVLFHCYGRKRTMADVVAPVVAMMQGRAWHTTTQTGG
jgi:hypothetical protein